MTGTSLETGKKHRAEQRAESKALKWTIILSSAAIGLMVDHFLPGWGRPVLLTLLIFGSLVGFCQPYWGIPFWTVAVGLFALHSALVFHFKTTINELSLPGIFVCAVVEVIVIAIILGLVFPDKKQSPLQH